MKLYFVRHGKTEWNLEGRLQGAKGDSPLLKESIEQVRELGHYLSDTHFDLVFSSDLPRAKKTTELIMEQPAAYPERQRRCLLQAQPALYNGVRTSEVPERLYVQNRFRIRLLYASRQVQRQRKRAVQLQQEAGSDPCCIKRPDSRLHL